MSTTLEPVTLADEIPSFLADATPSPNAAAVEIIDQALAAYGSGRTLIDVAELVDVLLDLRRALN